MDQDILGVAAAPGDGLRLKGTAGDDKLVGGDGDDQLDGGAGDDIFDGAGGFDTVFIDPPSGARVDLAIVGWQLTGEGSDTFVSIEAVSGGAGPDILRGDEVANNLNGQGGDDLLIGRGGNDSLSGSVGNDELRGGDGDDSLNGGAGDDLAYGEAGDDLFWVDSSDYLLTAGDDSLDGGDGSDTIQVGSVIGGATIDLSVTTRQQIAPGAWLTLKSVENLYGADTNDRLTGDAGDNTIGGWGGYDHIDGGAGVDTASMRGLRDDYAVTWTVDGWNVTDMRPGHPDAVQIITNVEYLKFYDNQILLGDGVWQLAANALRSIGPAVIAFGRQLSADLGAGTITAAQVLESVLTRADATTSVATLSY